MIKNGLFLNEYYQYPNGKAAVQAQDKAIEFFQRIDNLNRRAAVLKEIAVEVFEDCLKQAERL